VLAIIYIHKQMQLLELYVIFLIPKFRLVLNVLWFPLGNTPTSEFYIPTFRNTLSVQSSCSWIWNSQSVPKRRHIKVRRRGITQKKAYDICIYFHTPDISEINRHPQGKSNAKEIYNIIYILYISLYLCLTENDDLSLKHAGRSKFVCNTWFYFVRVLVYIND
jgi:hypothetical protein